MNEISWETPVNTKPNNKVLAFTWTNDALRWRNNGRDSVSNHNLTIVYSTVYSGADKKKNIKVPRHWPLCVGNSPGPGEFPAQMASNAGNVSIWWRHHGLVHAHIYASVGLNVLTNTN